jgi:hypothetical protein
MSTEGLAKTKSGRRLRNGLAASASPLPFGDVSFGHLCSRGRPFLDGALLGDESDQPVRPQARCHWRARGEHEGNTYRNCSQLGLCAFDCSGGRLSIPDKGKVDVRDVSARMSPKNDRYPHTSRSRDGKGYSACSMDLGGCDPSTYFIQKC